MKYIFSRVYSPFTLVAYVTALQIILKLPIREWEQILAIVVAMIIIHSISSAIYEHMDRKERQREMQRVLLEKLAQAFGGRGRGVEVHIHRL